MLAFYLSIIETEPNKNKFEILYDSYLELMHNVAFSILQSSDDADDAVQESLYKIANNIKKIDDVNSDKTRAFICTIVKNTSLNILKKRKRQKIIDVSIYDIPISEQEAYQKIYSRDVIRLVNELPDGCKDVLLLKLYYGMSARKIANTLEISEKAVNQRLFRARKILSEVLNEE